MAFELDCTLAGNLGGLKFEECFFQGQLVIDSFKYPITFKDCSFEKGIRILSKAEFDGEIDFISCTVTGDIVVDDVTLKEVCNWSFKGYPRLLITNGSFKRLNIGYWGGCELKVLNLEATGTKGEIRVIGVQTRIEQLFVRGTSPDLNIQLEYFKCNRLDFYKYRNGKGLSISRIKPIEFNKSCLSFVESSLGKAEFFDVNFQRFDQIYITEVNLVECSFISVTWPKDIQSIHPPTAGDDEMEKRELVLQLEKKRSIISVTWPKDTQSIHPPTAGNDEMEKSELVLQLEKRRSTAELSRRKLKNHPLVLEYYTRKREVLRQLKFAMGKQGDVINEQSFHAQEMIAYNRSLALRKFFWTKLIIKFSQYFGRFGQSYQWPLFWLLIGHWVLFLLLVGCNQIDGLSLSICHPNSEGFKYSFEKYFQLINPIRKIDDTFKGYFTIVDILMRIWSSYMLYNIIRATRRFIK
ncbi:MAG TPA: hypothetical protein VM802_18145 [Chitinophaga sp.]|uniref:hypothetical protein n=1 Tax=Chitinophaga sp. TaxID=1869181 RepID=UPI002B51E955|nr:hypothetical protein [Chitinophaga sp.]HVI46806.1 hypothetical protein [Chitinophaga sp.]